MLETKVVLHKHDLFRLEIWEGSTTGESVLIDVPGINCID